MNKHFLLASLVCASLCVTSFQVRQGQSVDVRKDGNTFSATAGACNLIVDSQNGYLEDQIFKGNSAIAGVAIYGAPNLGTTSALVEDTKISTTALGTDEETSSEDSILDETSETEEAENTDNEVVTEEEETIIEDDVEATEEYIEEHAMDGIEEVEASAEFEIVHYTPVTRQYPIQLDATSYDILLRCVQAEAGICGFECKEAVAEVILNRCVSPKFAQTNVHDVVYADHQFDVVRNGSIDTVIVDDVTIAAVNEALTTQHHPSEMLFFRTDYYFDDSSLVDYMPLDNTYFSLKY